MQEIEIEYKNLLTKHEFDRLLHELPFPEKGQKQINHYFETINFDFQANKSAIRIREKNNTYTLTVKQPHPDGILETNDVLTKQEADQWINGHPFLKPNTGQQLRTLHIHPEQLIYFGHLTTIRRTILLNHTTVVIDQSHYNKHQDFELELEAADHHTGQKQFNKILKKYQIQPRQTKNKIERFFSTLNK